jgi:hypothetical protein
MMAAKVENIPANAKYPGTFIVDKAENQKKLKTCSYKDQNYAFPFRFYRMIDIC